MASVTVGESQLQRIIRDLQDAVLELKQEQQDLREPVTDDSASLHKFCYKLEYLLQFDQKEKKTLLGTRKDYWDYFCDCLVKMKGASDGLRYVRSIPELKTSLGKGRAFIRYSLVHQRLADTLQQCLMNQRVTSDWYYARSPFLKPHLNVDIVNHLYELNEVQFDVASRGYDLDSSWPTFARRTLGSPAQLWRPPSRSSSVSSLVSSYSQQAPELLCSPELSPGFLGDVCVPGSASCCGTEDMRLELDRSELRQRQLQEHVEQLNEEAEGLREQVRALEEQQEAAEQEMDLEARLSGAEQRNTELLARLDAALFEKGQQVAGQQDSAQKIHALLDKLNKAEKGRLEAQREAEELRRRKAVVPMEERIAELQHANDKLRGDLAVKEKESSNLQMQMLDLQGALEVTERQVQEARRRTQEEKEELEEKHSRVREALEGQFHALAEQLKVKEVELSKSKEKIRLLEEQKEEVLGEKEGLSAQLTEMEASVLGQVWKTEDYKVQCSTLVELNAKLFEMVRRNEEAKMELAEARVALQGELSALRTLKTDSLQWPGNTADDLVKSITEEMVEGDAQRLEQENQELREEQGAVKAALSSVQEELRFFGSHIAELERSLASSSRTESSLREQLRETSALLEERGRWCKELQARLEVVEREQSGTGSSLSRLALEGQLELREKEVSRLQSEAVDLRCELQHLAEEKLKSHAQLEVVEASREELKGQVEELKGQVEELNLRHVQEILRHQQREEALDREAEVQAFEGASTREELAALKRYQERLSLESSEAKEALRRADAVVDELGVRVRDLTAHNEEASARLKELAEENSGLQEELRRFEGIKASTRELQERLEQAESRARELHESARAEADTVRFQLSSEALNHQNKLKCIHEELAGVKAQLTAERDRVSGLEAEVSQLKAENCGCSQLLEERRVLIEKSESVIRQKDAELDRLSENLTKCEGELAAMRAACHNIQEQLDRTVSKRRDAEMKMSAEIDDLYRTKKNLEERLIELIREKDELWQKSDALEFQQKLRCEGLSDRDGSQCLGCQEQFSWFLRRHPCRLCSRTLCYYCSNSTTRMLPSGKRERCCRDCGLVQERPLEANSGSSSSSNSHSSPCRAASSIKVTDQSPINDDGAFDIITEEELNGEYDSDSLSRTPERSQGSPKHRSLGLSSSTRHTSLDSDDLTPAVQDAETYLLKSGELTLTVPLSVQEIACFGQDCRELFVKSSCYSTIPIAVPDAGHTISWSFSSEPKSISFSMVHREAEDAPVEQSKVLIPLTRCNSHKETVQGQVKVRSPGIYTLIFDNSFSRFISKKVLYHLAIKKSDIA